MAIGFDEYFYRVVIEDLCFGYCVFVGFFEIEEKLLVKDAQKSDPERKGQEDFRSAGRSDQMMGKQKMEGGEEKDKAHAFVRDFPSMIRQELEQGDAQQENHEPKRNRAQVHRKSFVEGEKVVDQMRRKFFQ